MAGIVTGESSHHGAADDNSCKRSKDKQEEALGCRYMSMNEIMENSPSKKDGMDWEKETYYRMIYCAFLQYLGMKLRMPQVTIATAINFYHRFFLRQSHAKNDRWTIATVCMFLAGKVEETPRPLKNVILYSYAIMHKKTLTAWNPIKQKEVFAQQQGLILLGEKVVLATLGFALDVQHPYKPLVEALHKFNAIKSPLAKVAWNFVNDGLRTLLCVQFKPHHIAAGAIFLATKFLKLKLTSDGEKVWWLEFDVTPRQLEEISNQILELYDKYSVPPSKGSEAKGNAGGGTNASAVNEERALKQIPSAIKHASEKDLELHLREKAKQIIYKSAEMGGEITDQMVDLEIRDSPQERISGMKEGKVGEIRMIEVAKILDKDKMKAAFERQREEGEEGGKTTKEVIKIFDKDKVKAALERLGRSEGSEGNQS